MDYKTWRDRLSGDGETLELLKMLMDDIIPEHDTKLQMLFGLIEDKLVNPINGGNRKILIFSACSDTAEYLYTNVSAFVKSKFGLDTAMITGSVDGKTTIKGQRASMNEVLTFKYCKAQPKRLQEEVVDIEDMQSGISIMDLGLNEFRLDLLEYVKHNNGMDTVPFGLHAVVPAFEDCSPGVVFFLKNRNNSVNIDMQNRLHPFYMVYVGTNGEVVCDHLSPKGLLDKIRSLYKGKGTTVIDVCRASNVETKDGRDMRGVFTLLSDVINSIIEVKEESDIDSLFSPGWYICTEY